MKQLSIIILLFSGLCCTDKPEQPYVPVTIPCTLSKNIDTVKLYIKGTWEWLEEIRYYFGQPGPVYLTPQTEGYTSRMEIGSDTLRFFKNNKPDSVYTYKILLQHDVTGTNYPEDQDPALVLYRLYDGLRNNYIPIKICPDFLLLQHQYVSSVVGPRIWKKQ